MILLIIKNIFNSFSLHNIINNIINNFSTDNDLYLKCLKNQYTIVKKYFNKEWLRNYILSKIYFLLGGIKSI